MECNQTINCNGTIAPFEGEVKFDCDKKTIENGGVIDSAHKADV